MPKISAEAREQRSDEILAAAANTDFTDEELAEIDTYAGVVDGVDLWKVSADL